MSRGSITDEEAAAAMNSGLKLKPSRTRLAEKQVQQTFDERVSETHSRLEGHLKEAYELGLDFTKLMEDSRLSENIGPFETGFEKEIIRKLIDYGMKVNSDLQEKDGMGSISLILLVLKSLFKMRDRINHVSYSNYLLEKRLQQVEKFILSSQAKAAESE